MYTWRLGTELDALVFTESNEVLIAPGEKKSDNSVTLSKTEMDRSKIPFKIKLSENKFKLRFSENLVPQIKHKDIPGDSWYTVKNIVFNDYLYEEGFRKEIRKMIAAAGTIEESNKDFEAAFSDEYPGKIRLITDTSPDYTSCFNEMNRRLNCKLYKRTKKWVTGHRYDTEYRTYYYLGEYYSSKEEGGDSVYKRNVRRLPLIVEDPGNCKTISEILKTFTFGYNKSNIYALDSIKMAVDAGEVLKDDVPNIQDLWNDMVDLAINKGENIGKIFEIFKYSTKPQSKVDVNQHFIWRDKLVERLEEELKKTALIYWDLKSSVVPNNCRISPTFEHNAEGLWDLYCQTYLGDEANSKKLEYFRDLLNDLGIDILDICKKTTDNFTLDRDMFIDFDLYNKYGELYFKYHDAKSSRIDIIQRKGVLPLSHERVKLEDTFPENLKKTLVNLINKSIVNYGQGVDKFYLRNDGSRTNPIEYYEITIKLKDIIESYKSLSEIPETLKDEIMKSRFWMLRIQIDANTAVQ